MLLQHIPEQEHPAGRSVEHLLALLIAEINIKYEEDIENCSVEVIDQSVSSRKKSAQSSLRFIQAFAQEQEVNQVPKDSGCMKTEQLKSVDEEQYDKDGRKSEDEEEDDQTTLDLLRKVRERLGGTDASIAQSVFTGDSSNGKILSESKIKAVEELIEALAKSKKRTTQSKAIRRGKCLPNEEKSGLYLPHETKIKRNRPVILSSSQSSDLPVIAFGVPSQETSDMDPLIVAKEQKPCPDNTKSIDKQDVNQINYSFDEAKEELEQPSRVETQPLKGEVVTSNVVEAEKSIRNDHKASEIVPKLDTTMEDTNSGRTAEIAFVKDVEQPKEVCARVVATEECITIPRTNLSMENNDCDDSEILSILQGKKEYIEVSTEDGIEVLTDTCDNNLQPTSVESAPFFSNKCLTPRHVPRDGPAWEFIKHCVKPKRMRLRTPRVFKLRKKANECGTTKATFYTKTKGTIVGGSTKAQSSQMAKFKYSEEELDRFVESLKEMEAYAQYAEEESIKESCGTQFSVSADIATAASAKEVEYCLENSERQTIREEKTSHKESSTSAAVVAMNGIESYAQNAVEETTQDEEASPKKSSTGTATGVSTNYNINSVIPLSDSREIIAGTSTEESVACSQTTAPANNTTRTPTPEPKSLDTKPTPIIAIEDNTEENNFSEDDTTSDALSTDENTQGSVSSPTYTVFSDDESGYTSEAYKSLQESSCSPRHSMQLTFTTSDDSHMFHDEEIDDDIKSIRDLSSVVIQESTSVAKEIHMEVTSMMRVGTIKKWFCFAYPTIENDSTVSHS